MTEEELKQEAEEWIIKNSKEFITNPNYSPFDYAEGIYLAGAEPREKRIAELEDKLTKKVTLESLDVVSARIKELEKENAELKTKVNGQSERISELTQELDDKINHFG